MFKKRLGIIAFVLIITIALALPVVRADNETNNNQAGNPEVTSTDVSNPEATPISENPEGTENSNNAQNTSVSEENFKQHDVYLTGDDVTIDYIVDGNLFVFANNVTINSQIGGDAFIFAKNVTVSEQGYVFSNLFTVASTVNVQGVVYDLYAISKDVNITGYIYRDVKISAENLNIFGTIGRNAFVNTNNIQFAQNNSTDENLKSSQGMINGNLEYTSKSELNIPEGTVTGEIKHNQEKVVASRSIQSYLLSLGVVVITAILVWLVCLWLAPKFVKNENLISKKNILPEVGLGILTPIVLIVVSILLMLLGITASFGLLILGLAFMLISISTSIFIIAINNLICNKLKINKTIGNFGMLIVTAFVLWLIGLIPYVGPIIGIIAVIIGLGIITYYLIKRNKTDVIKVNKENDKDIKNKKEPKKSKKENKKDEK